MSERKYKKIAFEAGEKPGAQEACERLRERYDGCKASDADVIVAMGGDGFMLEMLHAHMGEDRPVFGMNFGSVGFLMNEYREDGLIERLEAAEPACIHPLSMSGKRVNGEFWCTTDNGFGNPANSWDYPLHIHKMQIQKPFTYRHGESTYLIRYTI